jgi:hypothetical protein
VNDLERLGLLKLDSPCAVLSLIGQLLTAVEPGERKRRRLVVLFTRNTVFFVEEENKLSVDRKMFSLLLLLL